MYQDDFEGYDEDSFDGRPNRRPLWWPVAAAFEMCVAAVVEFVGSFAERSEMVMGRIVAALPILFMPWQWFNRSANDVDLGEIDETDKFNQETNIAWRKINEGFFFLTTPLVQAAFGVWEIVGTFAERFMPRHIFSPLYWCVDLLATGYDFFGEWWYSRDFRKLVFAVPAIGMVAILCGSSVLGFLNSSNKKIQRYTMALVAAEEANDAEQALLFETEAGTTRF